MGMEKTNTKGLSHSKPTHLSPGMGDQISLSCTHGGDVQRRCRQLVIQTCEIEEVRILKGVVSKDHVHIHVEYPPRLAISQLKKRLKGCTSRKLQQEFPKLKKRYWGCHFWATGYGAWSTGNITDEMVQEYLEHHRSKNGDDNSDFIIE